MKWYDAPIGKNKVIDRSAWPDFVNMTAMVEDYHAYCRRLPRGTYSDSLNETQLAVIMSKKGVKDPEHKATRVVVEEYDERRASTVKTRVRLVTPPHRGKIQDYLRMKYGYNALHGLTKVMRKIIKYD